MKIFLILLFSLGFLLLLTLVAVGQPPPMLPTAPDQSPIDGGLVLIAAAGGTYAWKKLRKNSA